MELRVKKKNRKRLKQALRSLFIEAELKSNDKIVSDAEVRAFVKEHLDDYIEQQWSFIAKRIF